MQDPALRVAIVVRVVDNYGDAGVAWRLARQLHHEHACVVALWIDDRAALATFRHDYDAEREDAFVDGVRVRALPPAMSAVPPPHDPWPQVVVDAFGGGLPDAWLDAFEASAKPPVWIVLEYLSAEDWVEGVHALPSPPPSRRLPRWFFCPGFTPRTGGLLRERALLARRDAFRAMPDWRDVPWTSLGLSAPAPQALRISLFCYPSNAVRSLLATWAAQSQPVACLVPHGVATDAVHGFLGAGAAPGTEHRRGALALAVVPFVDPEALDRRLWACDLSLVRGEDSFVRAQWAARPFVWNIYPQADAVHRGKLDAFLARYCTGLDPSAAHALGTFSRAFDGGDGATVASGWPALQRCLPALDAHAARWSQHLAGMRDLATQLVDFSRSRL